MQITVFLLTVTTLLLSYVRTSFTHTQTDSESLPHPDETTPLLPPGTVNSLHTHTLSPVSVCVCVCVYRKPVVNAIIITNLCVCVLCVVCCVCVCVTGSLLSQDSSSSVPSEKSDEYEIKKKYEMVRSEILSFNLTILYRLYTPGYNGKYVLSSRYIYTVHTHIIYCVN